MNRKPFRHYTVCDPLDPEGNTCLKVAFVIDNPGCAAQTYGPPELCYPAEPIELSLDKAVNEAGVDVLPLLTTEQAETIELDIIENYQPSRDDFNPYED